tara:strand:- start:543 stop:1139 length:597 start_codon:yes stop_codon:yes gene_type:complete
MIVIGILGDIGSGKTYISKLFNSPVFNADSEVNKIYKKNINCFKKLKRKIPEHIKSYPIKKNELIKAVVSKQNNLKKITKIIHPIIRTNIKKFMMKNKNKKIVVLDIPLLLENKLNKKDYILVFVDAKKKDIQKRLNKRQNFNPNLHYKLRKIQLPLEIKKKKSNFIIKNNFKNLSVKKNVRILKNLILKNERNRIRY